MTTLTVERTPVGRGLWLQWVLANIAGWAVAWALFGSFSERLEQLNQIGHPVGWIVGGAVVGALQWRVLRRQIDLSAWSILASSGGLLAGFILGWSLGGPPFDFLLAFVMVGLLNGIVQWRALRPLVDRAGWWVLASSLGFAVGGAVGIGLLFAVGDPVIRAFSAVVSNAFGGGASGEVASFAAVLLVLGVVGGAVGGAMSGIVLVRLLEQRAPQRVQPATPAM
jgi:hypothetical protein